MVIGAGAFGGWTALRLGRLGAEVTLVDSWGPGHARASSGGETRVLRRSYPEGDFVRLADRARLLWLEEERRSGLRLFEPIGVLWMSTAPGEFERRSMENLEAHGVPFERLDPSEIARRYPQLRSDDMYGGFFEPGAGYLRASAACRAVRDALVAEGGCYLQAWCEPGEIRSGELSGLTLPDGSTRAADRYVFAGGPWLAGQFGERLGISLRVTRQEVFVFGTPRGDDRFGPGRLPVWAWLGDRFWYGIPGEGSVGGFKVADDTRGPSFDPTSADRIPSADGLERVRNFLADRFPGMAGAPLVDAAVCQYTEAPGGRFLADRLPGTSNAWVSGGGSGHGFKHGPAIGEYLASLVIGDREPGTDRAFSTVEEIRTPR
ncbi:FAD-dependent oxidoreductase [Tautonia plasticadhaerens]|nr:FAD-dependent oxidoreductase [Tautonia plasticadhaerens]